ncbi:hypothetical protein QIY50_23485 [Pseudomonas putida]|nr:hypothetical protein QIY50_23485 [Pseudomonas putida]
MKTLSQLAEYLKNCIKAQAAFHEPGQSAVKACEQLPESIAGRNLISNDYRLQVSGRRALTNTSFNIIPIMRILA